MSRREAQYYRIIPIMQNVSVCTYSAQKQQKKGRHTLKLVNTYRQRLWMTFVYIFIIILIFLQCANVIETKKAFNLSLSNYMEPEENDEVQN